MNTTFSLVPRFTMTSSSKNTLHAAYMIYEGLSTTTNLELILPLSLVSPNYSKALIAHGEKVCARFSGY